MRFLIAAIGKAKAGPERELYLEYTKRLPWKVECREFDAKLPDPKQRKEREGQLLIDACKGYDRLIALDENGKMLTSRELAGQIGQWQQQGHSSFACIIGGSDGLPDAVLKTSHLAFSLGRVTWPHMLVRSLVAEQLYRAHSILTGHPYHRD